MFESETHGYDTVDHLAASTGGWAPRQDLRDLIETPATRGASRVLLDGVFNHVGRDFPQFREVLRAGAGRPGRGRGSTSMPAASGPDGFGYRDFEGHSALVAARPRATPRWPTTSAGS